MLRHDALPDSFQDGELRRATQHRNATGCALSRADRSREGAPHAHGVLLAFRDHRLRVLVADDRTRGSIRLLADEDAVDGSGLLQTRCRVDDVAGDDPFSLRRTRGERHESLSGVDCDADLQFELRLGSIQLFNGRAHREGGSDCTFRIVAVDHGRSENRHHGVAYELLDRAAKGLDLAPDASEVWREDRPHVFRIEPFCAGGEADQIREQDGDDLALLGEALRLIGKRLRAGKAELRDRRVLLPTVRTDHHRQSVRTKAERV